jgi:hypothetical protein
LDTDCAKEVNSLTKAQIISQAAFVVSARPKRCVEKLS